MPVHFRTIKQKLKEELYFYKGWQIYRLLKMTSFQILYLIKHHHRVVPFIAKTVIV